MSPAPIRFHDPGTTVSAFSSSMLVQCPRCSRLAHYEVRPTNTEGPGGRSYPERRLVCRSCGLSHVSSGPGNGRPHLDLWLKTDTRHGTVWAYNLEHLDHLRRFVAATLRERAPWYEHGRKMTYVARLPAWIKQAKNRAEVLRAIDRLRRSVITG